MSRVRLSPAVASAILVAALVFSILPSAQAAVGDFLFHIGVDYHFDAPSGVVTDASGQAYLVDSRDNDVYVFDADGNLLRRFPVSDSYSEGIADIGHHPARLRIRSACGPPRGRACNRRSRRLRPFGRLRHASPR